MQNKENFEIDLYKAQKILTKKASQEFAIVTTMWLSTIRLLITLSSSFLVLTIALVDKIFPSNAQPLSIYLIISWIGYFCSIIFGIITEINEIIFHGNNARDKSKLAEEMRQKISRGESQDLIENGSHINNSIIFGVLCIDLFIISTGFLCISFLKNFINEKTSIWSMVIVIFLTIIMNIYFVTKRKQ